MWVSGDENIADWGRTNCGRGEYLSDLVDAYPKPMKNLFGTLFITLIISIVLIIPALMSRLQSSISMHYLIGDLDSVESWPNPDSGVLIESFLASAAMWDADNFTMWRTLGFVAWSRGDDKEALQNWQHLNLTAEDYVSYGRSRSIRYRNPLEALRWYELAEQISPNFAKLWLDVGQICQAEAGYLDICSRFLQYNNGNLFVDPHFEFDRDGWRFNRREAVDYDIVQCPGRDQHKCAKVDTLNNVSQPGVSWHQCFRIEPERVYHYSAWIRVDADSTSSWRPLYFQGAINGDAQGNWPGDEANSSDWVYWERTFVAPKFDAERACFHPISLFGGGQAWFYDANLSLVEK